jgi:Rrf2 family protein
MKISTKSQYGLRAMIYLAKHYKKKDFYSLKEIAKKEGIPFDYLEKIMEKLREKGLLKTKKGIGGGYSLAFPPKKITLAEIVGALEEIKPLDCFLCPKMKTCQAKEAWGEFHASINETLRSINLEDLIKKGQKSS